MFVNYLFQLFSDRKPSNMRALSYFLLPYSKPSLFKRRTFCLWQLLTQELKTGLWSREALEDVAFSGRTLFVF